MVGGGGGGKVAHRSKSHGRSVESGTSNSSEYGENMRLERKGEGGNKYVIVGERKEGGGKRKKKEGGEGEEGGEWK